MSSVPFSYNSENIIDSMANPSGVVVTNSETAAFFRRYLIQKAMSVFEWKLPENWNKSYFLYSLYIRGHIAVVETDKYGVICQSGCPYGYDIYYQPNRYQIANPLLRGLLNPVINRECTVFKMAPDWRGIGDLVAFYADYMALAAQSLGMNLINSKLSYIFTAADKTAAESMKKAFDGVMDGKPAVFIDKKLLDSNGDLSMKMLQQNVGQNFISNDLLDTWTTLEQKFATAIGIPNANTDKKERLIVDEVNANNTETMALVDMWYNGWLETIEKTKKIFPGVGELSVEWRVKPNMNGGGDDGEKRDVVNSGAV